MKTFVPILLAASVLLSTLAFANPRTVVALEDTHFRPVHDDDHDIRGVLVDILGDLAAFDGANEVEIDETLSVSVLKTQIIGRIAALSDDSGPSADRLPCGGDDNVTGGWGFIDPLGQHHEVWLCGNGTSEHYVDGASTSG